MTSFFTLFSMIDLKKYWKQSEVGWVAAGWSEQLWKSG